MANNIFAGKGNMLVTKTAKTLAGYGFNENTVTFVARTIPTLQSAKPGSNFNSLTGVIPVNTALWVEAKVDMDKNDDFYPTYADPSTIDTDAQAYITAASVSSAPHKTAIDNFVKGLKASGGALWNKTKAIYPLYGTAIATAKFNLKDVADTDAAHRLTQAGTGAFAGGFTNSDAAGSALNTHLAPADFTGGWSGLVVVKTHVGTGDYQTALGIKPAGGIPNGVLLLFQHAEPTPSLAGNAAAGDFNDSPLYPNYPGVPGTYVLTGGADIKLYRNGTFLEGKPQDMTKDTAPFLIGNGYPNGDDAIFTGKLGTVVLADELTDAEATALTTLVNTFEAAIRA